MRYQNLLGVSKATIAGNLVKPGILPGIPDMFASLYITLHHCSRKAGRGCTSSQVAGMLTKMVNHRLLQFVLKAAVLSSKSAEFIGTAGIVQHRFILPVSTHIATVTENGFSLKQQ